MGFMKLWVTEQAHCKFCFAQTFCVTAARKWGLLGMLLAFSPVQVGANIGSKTGELKISNWV